MSLAEFSEDSLPADVRPLFHELNKSLAPHDVMFRENVSHYFTVGASALKNIHLAVAAADVTPIAILDFGCGAGRVTRWLRAGFPLATIEGCDIREDDLRFVAGTFDVRTWVSCVEVDRLNAPSTYDLIWVGSVFTHLSKEVSVQLFDRLVSWLRPGGVLVFTSHGRRVVTLGSQLGYYGIPEGWDKVVADFNTNEFGYADYHDSPGYGMSITQLYWWAGLITSRANLRLTLMTEHSWDNHQDVVAVQRQAN